MKALLVGCSCVFALAVAATLRDQGYQMKPPGSVTYWKDVRPILEKKCLTCHTQDGPTPFPLETYEDAKRRALLINVVTSEGTMPPCAGESDFGEFCITGPLSTAERFTLKQWSLDGAPEGKATGVAPITKPPEWRLGEPDRTVSLKLPREVPADGAPFWHEFEYQVTEDLSLRTFELSQSSLRIARAVELFLHGTPRMRIGRTAMGYKRALAPEGVGFKICKGQKLIARVRLHPTGKPEDVELRLGLHLLETPPKVTPGWLSLNAGDFELRPGDRTFSLTREAKVQEDCKVLSVRPEARLFCSQLVVRIEKPGEPSKTLLRVPSWNPFLNGAYPMEEPVALPAGTVIRATWHFDNSAQNPLNPNNPPKQVRSGPAFEDPGGAVHIKVIPHQYTASHGRTDVDL